MGEKVGTEVFTSDIVNNFTSLLRGERPEGMDFERFKLLRKVVNQMNKKRLMGKLVHVSTKYGLPKGYGVTYVKPKEV